MQDIATKLIRIAAAAKAAGLTSDQARHLIHGTGGSPRRAKLAIRWGLHDQLIDAYTATLSDAGSHPTAVAACNRLWAELVPSADEAGDAAAEVAAAQVIAAARAPKKARKSLAELVAAIG